MTKKLSDKYIAEKNIVKKILIGSRMTQIIYGETFHLLFERPFCPDEPKTTEFLLMLDTSCWFGDRDEWIFRIKSIENDVPDEGSDCLLAYELTRLKYYNQIQVETVDFFDEFFSITFEGKNILSIAYYAETDYAWILEEASQKKEQDKMVVGCQGNELFQNNIPASLY